MNSKYFQAIIFPEKVEPLNQALNKEIYSVERRLMAEVVNMQDQVLIDSIIKAAQEAGVSHLYLLDKTFIVEAIQEKLERMEKE